MTTETTTRAHEIPESQRANAAAAAFGTFGFPFEAEPTIYTMASRLSEDYKGGFWRFYKLDNGGFFMAPDTEKTFRAEWPENYSKETISAEAFGLVACLFACSHLSFGNGEAAGKAASNYHRLLEYVYEHPEASQILSLID